MKTTCNSSIEHTWKNQMLPLVRTLRVRADVDGRCGLKKQDSVAASRDLLLNKVAVASGGQDLRCREGQSDCGRREERIRVALESQIHHSAMIGPHAREKLVQKSGEHLKEFDIFLLR